MIFAKTISPSGPLKNAKGTRPDVESPMYATAVGLLIKGIEFNERNDQLIINEENKQEGELNSKESYFDKWAKALLKLLANEE